MDYNIIEWVDLLLIRNPIESDEVDMKMAKKLGYSILVSEILRENENLFYDSNRKLLQFPFGRARHGMTFRAIEEGYDFKLEFGFLVFDLKNQYAISYISDQGTDISLAKKFDEIEFPFLRYILMGLFSRR